jgi:hypothetical protein
LTLRELLESAASDLDDVAAAQSPGGGITWSRTTAIFTVLGAEGASAEFLLDPAIAAAAVRTPDAAPSPRGTGWVLFRPAALDAHAVDRTMAWFVSAYRRAKKR